MDSHIQNLLGLTEQQFQILTSIAKANKEHSEVSPVVIEKAYTSITQKPIQKPNLFLQLKYLIDMGILNKFGKANYAINKDQLKLLIQQKKEEHTKIADSCDNLIEKIEEIFGTIDEKPIVKFLTAGEFYKMATNLVRETVAMYIIDDFSPATMSEKAYKLLGMDEYVRVLRKRIAEGKLKMFNLTSLQAEGFFDYALQAHDNLDIAYQECLNALDIFVKDKRPGIERKFNKSSTGPMFLYETKFTKTLFLPIGMSKTSFFGAISIVSNKITDIYKRVFLENFANAKSLKEPFLSEIADITKKEIGKVYSKLKKSS